MASYHKCRRIADSSQSFLNGARLPLAIAGILSTVPAQALLPTLLPIVDSSPLIEMTETTGVELRVNNPAAARTAAEANTIAKDADDSSDNQITLLLASWRQQAATDNLAQDKTWRRLLYFLDDKKGLFAKANPQSLIDDPAFFLSRNGRNDSTAELDAMLVALANQIVGVTNPSNAVACRFPARVAWLANTLDIDESRLQADCLELDRWTAMLDTEQLSIMFAEEYLDNPTSAFAHTLLRLDSNISAANFDRIDRAYAFNDTVDGDADDPFVIYTIKSISGSYNNVIEIDPYPKKLADYLKKDERDTWTYKLALSPDEVQQIMRHIWETKDLDLPYYFTTDNCASEILRLLDVVRPQQSLLSQLPYVVVPADVVNLLNQQNLLATSRYTPSDSSVRQAQLNQAKQAAKLGYQTLTQDEINSIKSADINSASSVAIDGQTLLSPLMESIGVANNNPLDRHRLQRAQIAIGQRDSQSYVDLGLRAGFHDTLDRALGYPQFFDLEALKATLRFYDKKDSSAQNGNKQSVELQNLTLMHGRSFNPVNTANAGNSWGVSLEAKQVNDGSQKNGDAHLVGSGSFEYGKSWAFGALPSKTLSLDDKTNSTDKPLSGEMPQQLCYALAMGTVQGGRGINNGFRVGTGINAGCRYQLNNQLRLQAELQLPYWYHGDSQQSDVKTNYWQPLSTLGLQYDIDKNQALRLNASYDWQERISANNDIQLAYMRYF